MFTPKRRSQIHCGKLCNDRAAQRARYERDYVNRDPERHQNGRTGYAYSADPFVKKADPRRPKFFVARGSRFEGMHPNEVPKMPEGVFRIPVEE